MIKVVSCRPSVFQQMWTSRGDANTESGPVFVSSPFWRATPRCHSFDRRLIQSPVFMCSCAALTCRHIHLHTRVFFFFFKKKKKTGSTTGTASCPVRMASMPPWSLICTLLPSRLRSSSRSSRAATTGKPLALTSMSWNPGPARGSDQRALADHIDGSWHIIGIQEGTSFVTGSFLEENLYIANQRQYAVLLTKDTPLHGTSRAHRCRCRARTLTPHGRSKVWWSLASSAGLRPGVLVFHDHQHSYQL